MSNFRALRKRRGLTQATLAKQIGASQTRVSAHELGKRPLTMDQLLAAASCLETSVDYLLGRSSEAGSSRAGRHGNSLGPLTVEEDKALGQYLVFLRSRYGSEKARAKS